MLFNSYNREGFDLLESIFEERWAGIFEKEKTIDCLYKCEILHYGEDCVFQYRCFMS